MEKRSKVHPSAHAAADRPAHLVERYVEPRNEIEKTLVDDWQKLLGISPIGVQDDFFELGGHSLIAIRLVTQIKKAFALNISLDVLFEAPTIEKLSQIIKKQHPKLREITASSTPSLALQTDTDSVVRSSDWSPLVAIRQGDPGLVPFFCIHGAGGNILNFHALAKYLGDARAFYGLQAQGVDGICPPLNSVSGMAALYLSEIRKVQPQGPYLLGGYSGGGVVAVEMAQMLKQAGESVDLLVFLDTFHPSIEAMRTPIHQHLQRFMKQGIGYLRERYSERVLKSQESLNLEQVLTYIDEHPNEEIPAELREPYLVSTFIQALHKYEPLQYDGRVAQFTANDTWSMYRHAGPSRGWEGYLPNLEIYTVPGDHNSMVSEPSVRVLGARLATLLMSVDQGRERGL